VSDTKEILIVAETHMGRQLPITFELLAAGRQLADDWGGQHVVGAVLAGDAVAGLAQELVDHGADRVYVVGDASLAEFHPETYGQAIAQVVEQNQPEVLMLGQTDWGRDLAPWLAAHLGSGVVMNCIELSPQSDGGLEVMCPVFGGDARSVYRFDDVRPCVVTIQACAYDPAPVQEGYQGEIVTVTANLLADVRTRVVERVMTSGPKVEDATILVSGGVGLGKQENFQYIQELADLLGGMSAASRPVVDKGWATPAQQIGLTGKYVAPELYIAVGISGASQHMAGLSRARNIVAINHDPDAPIFRYCSYGVVADCLEFLPAFISKCREALGK